MEQLHRKFSINGLNRERGRE
ncbi:unnamed protein product [Spirodela intermedia]|uniref:Uncharacterized protein n=2 Tax=Spirodela intermedia TaxID=51605 RepID=A0A7I8K1T0_SPIIN|nr:unnamed protein product [Spirodela intermedia]CAA6655601.1 unnamed protein product [Spirodela intermedia]CAA7390915.1 unnamed protein product [Spirodela intermedia]